MREKNLLLWRLAFDRHGNIVANGKHPVGRVTHVLEDGIWFGTMMWNGSFFERRAKSREYLLAELRDAVGLTPKDVPAGETVQ